VVSDQPSEGMTVPGYVKRVCGSDDTSMMLQVAPPIYVHGHAHIHVYLWVHVYVLVHMCACVKVYNVFRQVI
jgi:hypothetical protein